MKKDSQNILNNINNQNNFDINSLKLDIENFTNFSKTKKY